MIYLLSYQLAIINGNHKISNCKYVTSSFKTKQGMFPIVTCIETIFLLTLITKRGRFRSFYQRTNVLTAVGVDLQLMVHFNIFMFYKYLHVSD
jgi:hypothetical protein